MRYDQPTLQWLTTQKERMIELLMRWSDINSHSENLEGLRAMSQALQEEFGKLSTQLTVTAVALEPQKRVDARGHISTQPLGKALVIQKHIKPTQRKSVLLSGHMDTVYSPESDFLTCRQLDSKTLLGPGVADLKGGLVVLLLALEAFERSPYANQLGWQVIINPDEEIGSTGSAPLLRASARKHHVGLVFEPALPDGSFVSARKGSANYTLISRGRAAHAGRDFHLGSNAIASLLPAMQELAALTDLAQGTTLNLGTIHAEGAVNIVPDLAIVRFGLRAKTSEAMAMAQKQIHAIVNRHEHLELVEISSRPPKIFDELTEQFYRQIKLCADTLNLPMRWQESGGVCDGNLLAAEGLPTIDTLGPVGGNLHTQQEYVDLDSLVLRAQLASLVLMQLATQQ